MPTKRINKEKARFDTRLPKEQKQYFERAARLGGFRNLTDFIILSAQEKAKKIIEESELTLASRKDNEVFFNAIENPEKPNSDLISAVKEYEKLFNK
ncbi:DUF1778 domain-containing protein [Bacteroidota bacterium]